MTYLQDVGGEVNAAGNNNKQPSIEVNKCFWFCFLIRFTYKIYIKYASREFDDEVIRFRT
jgi:hypothetical protein